MMVCSSGWSGHGLAVESGVRRPQPGLELALEVRAGPARARRRDDAASPAPVPRNVSGFVMRIVPAYMPG